MLLPWRYLPGDENVMANAFGGRRMFFGRRDRRISGLLADTDNPERKKHVSSWKLLLRRRQTGGHGITRGHGLLSLQLLPFLVRGARERLQSLEAGGVRITAGVEHVATFQKTELSQRRYCAKCGGHLMTNHPQIGPRRGLRVDHSDT
jgi:hypothetical protein